MSQYDPKVFFGTERFNTEKANNLKEAEVEALKEQNMYFKRLAETATQAAKSSEKSARQSKICTIISVIIAGLMFATTVIQVVLNFLNYFKH